MGTIELQMNRLSTPNVRVPWRFRMVGIWCRAIIGMVMIVTGLLESREPVRLMISIVDYEILNPRFAAMISIILPVLELLLGICLLVGIVVAASSLLSALVGTAFFLAQASAIARGLTIDCGCFGGLQSSQVGFQSLLMSALFAAVAILSSVIALRGARSKLKERA